MYYILILLFLSVVFFFLFRGKARHIPDTPVKDEVFVVPPCFRQIMPLIGR